MIKARVILDVMVEEDYGGVNLRFEKEVFSFESRSSTKVICVSTEIYPNVKVITAPPSNKVGELDDERSDDDPNKTDIH